MTAIDQARDHEADLAGAHALLAMFATNFRASREPSGKLSQTLPTSNS